MRIWGTVTLALAVSIIGCGEEQIAEPCSGTVQRVALEAFGRNPIPRTGDGLPVEVSAVNDCGRQISVTETRWTTTDSSVVTAEPTTVRVAGEDEVSESPDRAWVESVGFGSALVRAEVEGVTESLPVEVVRPRTRSEGLEVLGADSVPRRITDVWVHGDYAYSGTSSGECESPPCSSMSGSLIVWRLKESGLPELVDSIPLPGPKTNDVKVSPGGGYLVVSQEGDEATNGIVVLDLADPATPTILTHFTDDLEHGVHNLWLEAIDGTDYAFLAARGGDTGDGLRIMDFSDPASPRQVATYSGGSSQVHDVYVRDGLAFVSHWDDGLVIVDVGNGIAGGSPAEPVGVSSLVMEGGNTHNAWYWPEADLVFVGEERKATFSSDTADVGQLHVVDVSDLTDPREIAFHHIPGSTPHNFWVDEERELLYAAWYSRGVRVLDVSGTLSGDLSGREIGFAEPSGSTGLASIWAPQLHGGTLYLSDIFHGLWALRPMN